MLSRFLSPSFVCFSSPLNKIEQNQIKLLKHIQVLEKKCCRAKKIQLKSFAKKKGSVFNVVEGEAGQRATLNWQPVKTLTFITRLEKELFGIEKIHVLV